MGVFLCAPPDWLTASCISSLGLGRCISRPFRLKQACALIAAHLGNCSLRGESMFSSPAYVSHRSLCSAFCSYTCLNCADCCPAIHYVFSVHVVPHAGVLACLLKWPTISQPLPFKTLAVLSIQHACLELSVCCIPCPHLSFLPC